MEKVKCVFSKGIVVAENSDRARDLYNKSSFGSYQAAKLQFTLCETLYLAEKEKLEVVDGKGKTIPYREFVAKASGIEKDFWTRYCVYRDLRIRGYVVKTGLKFGAEFRVYGKGKKPGEEHAKWIVYSVNENNINKWRDFCAKNRVAHSTKKSLLIGIVDEEGDITYYESTWVKP